MVREAEAILSAIGPSASSAKEQGLTDGCGEVVRVGHMSASCIDMRLDSHIANGELCAFCKALVSHV